MELGAEHRDWLEDLYRRTHDRLRRFVSRACEAGSIPDAADDLLLETYIRAFERLEHLLRHPLPEAWLHVTARNLVLNEMRRAYRRREIARVIAREIDFLVAPPETAFLERETHEVLVTALRRVRARHRDVLSWSAEGLSYEQIADRLNAPMTTVPPLLFRARLALRREYLALLQADEL